MFSIVEFEKKECAIVPITWLLENNNMCYWPPYKKEDLVNKMVNSSYPPKPHWTKYKIKKVLFTGDNIQEVEEKLRVLIEESSSESGANSEERLRLKTVTDENCAAGSMGVLRGKSNTAEVEDSMSSSDEGGVPHRNGRKNKKRPNNSCDNNISYTNEDFLSECDDGNVQIKKTKRNNQLKSNIPKKLNSINNEGYLSDSDNEDVLVAQPKKKHQSKSKMPKKRDASGELVCDKLKNNELNNTSSLKTNTTSNSNLMTSKRQYRFESESDFELDVPDVSIGANLEGQNTNQVPTENATIVSSASTSRTNTPVTTAVNRIFHHTNTSFTANRTTTPTPSFVNSPASQATISNADTLFQKKVLSKLEKILSTQEQQSIYIDELLRLSQLTNIKSIVKPSAMPDLPLKMGREFQEMEDFLENERNFTYMRSRLATIGGSSVRNATMNILKFVLTNKLAMKFNWSGRDKVSFKKTHLMSAINEAVKLGFSSRSSDEVNDTIIATAVKDWLKLAKSRYSYNKNKQ